MTWPVAGPWREVGRTGRMMRAWPHEDVAYEAADVCPCAMGYAAMAGPESVVIERAGRLDRLVQAEAMAWCDARLREMGVVLLPG